MLSKKCTVTATVPVMDLDRASRFYRDKLRLKLISTSMEGYVMCQCGDGTGFLLYQRAPTKADHTLLTFFVDDVEAEVEELKGHGVIFEEYNSAGLQTKNGIATIGETKGAWFKDTEGNILGISELTPADKRVLQVSMASS